MNNPDCCPALQHSWDGEAACVQQLQFVMPPSSCNYCLFTHYRNVLIGYKPTKYTVRCSLHCSYALKVNQCFQCGFMQWCYSVVFLDLVHQYPCFGSSNDCRANFYLLSRIIPHIIQSLTMTDNIKWICPFLICSSFSCVDSKYNDYTFHRLRFIC